MSVGVLYGHTEAIYVVLCQYKDQCGHVIMSVGVLAIYVILCQCEDQCGHVIMLVGVLYGHTEAIYVVLR